MHTDVRPGSEDDDIPLSVLYEFVICSILRTVTTKLWLDDDRESDWILPIEPNPVLSLAQTC